MKNFKYKNEYNTYPQKAFDEGLDLEDNKIYCRLTASGFMDKTDFIGPFDIV